jgi:hypothetical protein
MWFGQRARQIFSFLKTKKPSQPDDDTMPIQSLYPSNPGKNVSATMTATSGAALLSVVNAHYGKACPVL